MMEILYWYAARCAGITFPLNEIQVLEQLIDLGRSDCPMPLQRLIQYRRATQAVESGNSPFSSDPFCIYI